jgi:hypothetical protein
MEKEKIKELMFDQTPVRKMSARSSSGQKKQNSAPKPDYYHKVYERVLTNFSQRINFIPQ